MIKEGTGLEGSEGAERIRQLAWGYIPAALIGVVMELGIPDLIGDKAKPISEIAAAAEANEDALYRMLRTLASFGILTESNGKLFALTSAGTCLRSDVPGSLHGYVRWVTNGLLFRCYADLLHCAKTGENALEHVLGESLFSYMHHTPELSKIFNDGMTSFSQIVSKGVLDTYDFSGIKVLADLGGGEGALLASIVQKYPGMRGLLLEQAHVVPGARKRFEQSALADRCSAEPVDFFKSVPSGADAYMMKSIIHDWDDERATVILKNCREALRDVERGRLILVEGVVPPGNEQHMVKISDMQMLVLAGGRERTREEFQNLLAPSGFRMTAVIPTQTFVSVLEALPT